MMKMNSRDFHSQVYRVQNPLYFETPARVCMDLFLDLWYLSFLFMICPAQYLLKHYHYIKVLTMRPINLTYHYMQTTPVFVILVKTWKRVKVLLILWSSVIEYGFFLSINDDETERMFIQYRWVVQYVHEYVNALSLNCYHFKFDWMLSPTQITCNLLQFFHKHLLCAIFCGVTGAMEPSMFSFGKRKLWEYFGIVSMYMGWILFSNSMVSRGCSLLCQRSGW